VRIDERAGEEFRERDRCGPVARGRALELAAPFARLGVGPGDRLTLGFRLVVGESGAPLARYPGEGTLPVTVPGDAFEAENWSA